MYNDVVIFKYKERYIMIRFILVATFVILFLILSIPLLLIEWIIGKFNMDLKDRSSQKIVNWAFRVCLFLAGTSVTVIGKGTDRQSRALRRKPQKLF